jgi:hypothetical protein
MKKIMLLVLLTGSFLFSQDTGLLKKGILPIVKISDYTDENGLRFKIPIGTALLMKDDIHFRNRLFLVTAKHVIEKDSVTDCMINFSKSSSPRKDIVSSVKKYKIFKNEWKFHKSDRINLLDRDTTFFTFDIAIAEIYLARIKIDGEDLWHSPLDAENFTTEYLRDDDSVKILAFPYINKFNWERGLTMGDLEEDKGIHRSNRREAIAFDKNKFVMDLNEILIENPKFRPGYSGGLVFYADSGSYKFSGVSMGMTNIVKRNQKHFCFGFYIKANNLKDALYYNFK